MKYIKTNEELMTELDVSLSNIEMVKLQKFCNDYLAYFIDEGNKVEVKSVITTTHYHYKRILIYAQLDRSKWVDIKDDIVPFIEMLNIKYSILPEIKISRLFNNSEIPSITLRYSISDIISDSFYSSMSNIYSKTVITVDVEIPK
jgi:hypothetical protein